MSEVHRFIHRWVLLTEGCSIATCRPRAAPRGSAARWALRHGAPEEEGWLAVTCCLLAVQRGSSLHTRVAQRSVVAPTSLSRFGCCCWLVAKSCPAPQPVDCSIQSTLPEFAHICVHWAGGGMQPSHPLPLPSPLGFNLSQP